MGVCKTLRVTPDYVLHEMSYQNVLLYTSATPVYENDNNSQKGGQIEFDDSLDASNPDNFADLPDEEIITSIH